MPSSFLNLNRVAGLASGIDTASIVRELMKAARAPVDRLLQKKQLLLWKQEDYRNLNTTLQSFRSQWTSVLRLQGTFLVKKAISSDESAVTATVTANAQPGTYNVNVTQLAQVATDISTTTLSLNAADKIDPNATLESQKAKFARPWGATTTLQFSITTYNPDGTPNSETFTIDTTVDSLNGVIAKINAKSNTLGITAFYEASTDKVVIATTKTGDYATNEIEIADVTDTFALGTLALSATAQGQNAIVDINGLTGIQQYENTFTLNNVTFTLKKPTGGTPVTVTVTHDTDTVFNTIKSFVEEFNKLLDTFNGKLNEPRYPDYQPLTDEQKRELTEYETKQWEEKAKSGLLQNDGILRDIVFELRQAITTPVQGLTNYNDIFDIGISTGFYYEGGKLYIDETKLREAISANAEGVMELFTANPTGATYEQKGLGIRLYEKVNEAVDRLTDEAGYPNTFMIYDQSFIGDSLRDLEDRIASMNYRLEQLEARYWRQFTVMEQVIAQFNSQSMWLTRQTSSNGG